MAGVAPNITGVDDNTPIANEEQLIQDYDNNSDNNSIDVRGDDADVEAPPEEEQDIRQDEEHVDVQLNQPAVDDNASSRDLPSVRDMPVEATPIEPVNHQVEPDGGGQDPPTRT